MKIELKINTNDKFQVVLTERGFEVFTKYIDKLLEESKLPNKDTFKFLYFENHEIKNTDNRRTYEFQLHELMNIFGSEMYVGNLYTCFVGNIITKIIERN